MRACPTLCLQVIYKFKIQVALTAWLKLRLWLCRIWHSTQQQTTTYIYRRGTAHCPKGWLFRTSDGRRPSSFNGLFRRLLRHCELLTNAARETRTLYSLRHTYATAELLAGTDIHTLAKQMGTSVGMLERHYSKLTATLAAGRST